MKLRHILDEITNQKYKPIFQYNIHEIFDFENKKLPSIHKLGKLAYTFEIEFNSSPVDVYIDFIPVNPSDLTLIPLVETATKIFNVAYAMSDNMVTTQMFKSDLNTINFIMYVVCDVVKDFVAENDVEILTFFATSKDDTVRGERQKMTMYREIAKKHKPPNFVIENLNNAGQSGFMLFDRVKILDRQKNKSNG